MAEKKLSQEEVWNKIAPDWNKFRTKPMPEVVDFLKGKEGNILDLGCGTGRHFVKVEGVSYYGTDFSEEMLKLAKENLKESGISAILKKSPANKIPFEKSLFDYAVYAFVLHCIPSQKEREESLKELLRVLKPKAHALISVWGRQHRVVKNKPKETFIKWRKINVKRFYYVYDKEELEGLLKSIGFKIIKSWEDENIWVEVEK